MANDDRHFRKAFHMTKGGDTRILSLCSTVCKASQAEGSQDIETFRCRDKNPASTRCRWLHAYRNFGGLFSYPEETTRYQIRDVTFRTVPDRISRLAKHIIEKFGTLLNT